MPCSENLRISIRYVSIRLRGDLAAPCRSDRMASQTLADANVLIGARIRLARKRAGLSQAALGRELGLTFQQVQKYENGRNRASGAALAVIAQACGVKLDFFLKALDQADDAAASVDMALIRSDPQLVRDVAALPPAERAAVRAVVRALAAARGARTVRRAA
jgi:transcriptional regulator with XRE-family HTH domain